MKPRINTGDFRNVSNVADCAISLGFLLSFARNVPDGFTTADVVQKIVVPATKDECCRYVALTSVPPSAVGTAKYFVSHRWAADFTRELVFLVAEHFIQSVDAHTSAGRGVSASPGIRNAQRVEPVASVTISGTGEASAADATSPSGIEANVAGIPRNRPPRVNSNPARCGASVRGSASCTSHPVPCAGPLSPPQQQQLTRGSTGGNPSLRPSLSASRTGHCSSSPLSRLPPPASATAASSTSSLHGPTPGVPASPFVSRSSLRLRAGREDSGTAGGFGSSVTGGNEPAGNAGGLGPPSDATPAGLSCSSQGASATYLPGSTFGNPTDDNSGAVDSNDVAVGPANCGGRSLNPLLARPADVRHQWPQRQFRSMCSRQSVCSSGSSSVGGSGGSFIRHGPTPLMQRVQAATEAEAPRGGTDSECRTTGSHARTSGSGVSGSRRDVPLIPLAGPATAAATTETGGADYARNRSSVTGALSYTGSQKVAFPRFLSVGDSGTVRRASSVHSGRPADSYDTAESRAAAAAAATAASAAGGTVTSRSRASEASDVVAAADRVAGTVSRSSSGSGDGSSGGGGGGGGSSSSGGNPAAAAATVTNITLVDRLTLQFAGREELLRNTYVWLDMFAINQHPNQQQADDLAQLQEVVSVVDATLLVLDGGGLVLTRIWCLYEIWQTVRRKGPESLRVLAGPLDFEELAYVWGELEVERAQATFRTDRDRILTDIRADRGGSQELNRHIKQAIVKSACQDLDTARAAAPRSPLHGERAYRAAFLLRTAGSGAAALAAAREAADVFCECLGPVHPHSLRALRSVAGCHKDLGAAQQAVGLLEQQVLPFLEEAYGPGHTESSALDELGMLYYTLGQYEMAYDMLLAALSQRLRQLQLCAATAVAAPQLAAALTAWPCSAAALAATATGCRSGGGDGYGLLASLEPLSGEHLTALLAALRALVSELKPAEAEAEAETEAVLWRQPSNGGTAAAAAAAAVAVCSSRSDSGPRVALWADVRGAVEAVGLSLHSLGLVQRAWAQRCRSADSSARVREARELLEASVGLLAASSSEASGLTALDARANLATLTMDGGEYQAAEQLLRDNLTLTERVYGRDHPYTATAANNLAMCLKRQRAASPDKSLEALSLYRRCLAVCARSLGECHPETLVVATNLGVLLADQRQWSESEALLTRAVAALPPQLGERHPDVLAAHRRLAEVLELRCKLFESEAMFRLTLQLAESGPPEGRDHGLVLECREGLQRVQEMMEAAGGRGPGGQGSSTCCIVS